MHKSLRLRKSFRHTFLNPATPMSIAGRIFSDPKNVGKGFKDGGTDRLREVMSKWVKDDLVILPPEPSQAFNQGGSFCFDKVRDGGGRDILYAHYDRSTGDHGDLKDMENVLEGMGGGL